MSLQNKPLEEIYKGSYFKGRERHLAWRAPIVCKAIVDLLPGVKSAMDVGCAVGDLVKGFLDLGLDAHGLEGSKNAYPYMMVPMDKIIEHDLRYRLETGRRFDLITCFEVAEHIEPEHARQFIENICSVATHWVILSAAPPGQGGTYHVNCQSPDYWIEEFRHLGFLYRNDLAESLKQALSPWRKKPGIKAYWQNTMVFERAT